MRRTFRHTILGELTELVSSNRERHCCDRLWTSKKSATSWKRRFI